MVERIYITERNNKTESEVVNTCTVPPIQYNTESCDSASQKTKILTILIPTYLTSPRQIPLPGQPTRRISPSPA